MSLFVLLAIYWITVVIVNALDPDINWILVASAWILVNCLDIHSTWLFLNKGTGEEGNPIVSWLFDKIGFWPTTLFVKMPLVLWFSYQLSQNYIYKNVAIALSLLFFFIVINNYRMATKKVTKPT